MLHKAFIILTFTFSLNAFSYCEFAGFPGSISDDKCIIDEVYSDYISVSNNCSGNEQICNPVVYGINSCAPSENVNHESCLNAQGSSDKYLALANDPQTAESSLFNNFYESLQSICNNDFEDNFELSESDYCQRSISKVSEYDEQISDGQNIAVNNSDVISDLSQDTSDIMTGFGIDLQRLDSDFLDSPTSDLDESDPTLGKREEEVYHFDFGDRKGLIDNVRRRGDQVLFDLEIDGSKKRFSINEIDFPLLTTTEFVEDLKVVNDSIEINDGFIDFSVPATHLKNLSDEQDSDQISCITSLSDYLSSGAFEDEDVQRFLKIQGELTLNKLAWANENLFDKSLEKKLLEDKILALIKEKFESTSGDVREEFGKVLELNKRSRTFLSKSVPLVQNILYEQGDLKGADQNFTLKSSDLKLLQIVAEREELVDGTYDDSISPDINSPKSIINFSAHINEAYAKREPAFVELKNVNKQTIELLTHQLRNKLGEIIYKSCVEQLGLSCVDSQRLVYSIIDDESSALESTLLTSLIGRDDDNVYKALKHSSFDR